MLILLCKNFNFWLKIGKTVKIKSEIIKSERNKEGRFRPTTVLTLATTQLFVTDRPNTNPTTNPVQFQRLTLFNSNDGSSLLQLQHRTLIPDSKFNSNNRPETQLLFKNLWRLCRMSLHCDHLPSLRRPNSISMRDRNPLHFNHRNPKNSPVLFWVDFLAVSTLLIDTDANLSCEKIRTVRYLHCVSLITKYEDSLCSLLWSRSGPFVGGNLDFVSVFR